MTTVKPFGRMINVLGVELCDPFTNWLVLRFLNPKLLISLNECEGNSVFKIIMIIDWNLMWNSSFAIFAWNAGTGTFTLEIYIEQRGPLFKIWQRILSTIRTYLRYALWPKHTSGRWSLATCIGQPTRLQHFEHHATSVLVSQYRSLATNDQKYVFDIS